MFAFSPKVITKFEWKELHGKIVKLGVAEPNPEVLEPYGQVYAMTEDAKVYLIHEWHFSDAELYAARDEGEK